MTEFGIKMSEIFTKLETNLWEREANIDTPPEFTVEGFRAATKIFMSVLMDKMWVVQDFDNMPMEERERMAHAAGEAMKKLVMSFTGIDTKELYATKE